MLEIEDTRRSSFVPDQPDDSHKPWNYKGFRIRWNKEDGAWKIFNSDGEYEWDGEARSICKDFIDSYDE
jgi:hypothetical protein